MTKLIVFGEDWASHPSSTQHLMPYIGQDIEVIWVNSIGMRRPTFSAKDLSRLWQKVVARLKAGQATESDTPAPFPVVKPLVIPLSKSRLLRWLNRKLLSAQISKHVKKGDQVWVWTSLPNAIEYQGAFSENGWFYYCGDDFEALAGVDHARVKPFEDYLINQAAHIWVASPYLKEKFSVVKHRVSVVEHGVNLQKFSEPNLKPAELRKDKPTLGFYGALADWIDQDLLLQIAQRLPDWQLMLIGPRLTDVSRLEAQPNIQLLPAKSHDELPAYLQHWQAAILPFKDCPQIHACNPLKLREYLASGTPVITTDFPALDPYRDLVKIVQCGESAALALEHLEYTDTLQARALRQNRMSNESWQSRAYGIRADMQRLMNNHSQLESFEKAILDGKTLS
ncbi:glycosyltransferase [Reinekea marinisedimentorum]|uniref:Glycosyltransferase involved in cell wall biosynthesis n=1 Tax=Reinekea marinisedimentorum TaxID=230495 RepID=A0A4R3IA70_9GAMM|nr:glycosyltransferase [Reinekea marinisedimentorum]TCS42379.1 glycosyltransferase involved in cell wall biosynthesis [Reinekea marinisedimentorum]